MAVARKTLGIDVDTRLRHVYVFHMFKSDFIIQSLF